MAVRTKLVAGDQFPPHIFRRKTRAEQIECARPVCRVRERLRRDSADAGAYPWHDRADAQEFGFDCDADLAKVRIGCDDRKGHPLSVKIESGMSALILKALNVDLRSAL